MGKKFVLTKVHEIEPDGELCGEGCCLLHHLNGHVTMPYCGPNKLEVRKVNRSARAERSLYCTQNAKEMSNESKGSASNKR